MISRLLILSLSTRGCGESVIALSLADQLRPAGVQTHFVVAPVGAALLRGGPHEHTIVDPRMRGLARLVFDDVVATFRPDAIVLADYFTFTGVAVRDFGLDPWFVHAYGVPVVPIDIWEWAAGDFVIDLADGTQLPVDRHLLDLPATLRPVPVAHPRRAGAALPFALARGSADGPAPATCDEHRQELGVRAGERLVLLTVSAWQRPGEQAAGSTVERLAAAVPALLAGHLRALPPSVRFLLVGHAPPELAALPGAITAPPCAPAMLDRHVAACDLVLSLNLGSTTVAKSAVSHTPTLVLVNEHRLADRTEVEAAVGPEPGGVVDRWLDRWAAELLPLHPFRVWPLGMYEFLAPLLRDNPFERAVSVAGLFDEKDVATHVEGLLFDRAWQAEAACGRADYRAAVAALPPTPEVLDQAVVLAGATVERCAR